MAKGKIRYKFTNTQKPVEWDNGIHEDSKGKIIEIPKQHSNYIKSDYRRQGATVNPYILNKVALPSETVGDCKNWKRCRQYNVILGNGLCMDCWDKKTGGRRYGESYRG